MSHRVMSFGQICSIQLLRSRSCHGLGELVMLMRYCIQRCRSPKCRRIQSWNGGMSSYAFTSFISLGNNPVPLCVRDSSRGWFMRCIKPSPCMFVCVVADRVGQTLFEYEPSLDVCQGVCRVWCVCLCSSRALPVVFPVARRICSFGVFELSLQVRGGEVRALTRLFYPYIRHRAPIERGPRRM